MKELHYGNCRIECSSLCQGIKSQDISAYAAWILSYLSSILSLFKYYFNHESSFLTLGIVVWQQIRNTTATTKMESFSSFFHSFQQYHKVLNNGICSDHGSHGKGFVDTWAQRLLWSSTALLRRMRFHDKWAKSICWWRPCDMSESLRKMLISGLELWMYSQRKRVH